MSEPTLSGARRQERTLLPVSLDYASVIPPGFQGWQPYPGVEVPRATLVNVAHLYCDLEQAIRNRTSPSPNFETGLGLHRLLDAIASASDTDTAVRVLSV